MAITSLTSRTPTGVVLPKSGKGGRPPRVSGAALPSCPNMSPPQPHTVPSAFSARLCPKPPASPITPSSSGVARTWFRLSKEPSPNCPCQLAPQLQSAPRESRAREWYPPAATTASSEPAPVAPLGVIRHRDNFRYTCVVGDDDDIGHGLRYRDHIGVVVGPGHYGFNLLMTQIHQSAGNE